MPLKIYNTPTENTHENEQFRRVAKILDVVFEKNKYTGVLIGNPFNELCNRFRADAVLLYDKGLIIIDFKDYNGTLYFSGHEEDFKNQKWYTLSEEGIEVEVKGGSRYINPFRQLATYRHDLQEYIKSNIRLTGLINYAKIGIVNIFSGPLSLHTNIPGRFRYYKIVEERALGNFLYDFNAERIYSEELAKALLNFFPSEEYVIDNSVVLTENVSVKEDVVIDKSLGDALDSFFADKENKICVLKSSDYRTRDNWVKQIPAVAFDNNFPQIEYWSHSSRISKLIERRSGIKTDGLYSVIYGGISQSDTSEGDQSQEEQELVQDVIPIKSAKNVIDDNTLIIVHEAHLVSRSFNQSELLRFGSGRLLEDMFKYLSTVENYKIILVGDPYSLTFGKEEDCALNVECLKEITKLSNIHTYLEPIPQEPDSSCNKVRYSLADDIDSGIYNHLSYPNGDDTLCEIEAEKITELLHQWYDKPLATVPDKHVLFFKKEDCTKTNLWIKKHCLKNGEGLATGDVLVVENNVILPDDTGFGNPTRISNGSYLSVCEVKEKFVEPTSVKQSKTLITLSFTKITARVLDAGGKIVEAIIFDNYFKSKDELSTYEQIAFQVFVNKKLRQQISKTPFAMSADYNTMLSSREYQDLTDEEREAIVLIVRGAEKIHTSDRARKLLAHFRNKYKSALMSRLRAEDQFVNAINAKYGWAITVHKSIGSQNKEIILKGFRKENDGIANESYFRWLYSGLTAGGKVYLNSPQTIHPMMDCVIDLDTRNGGLPRRAFLFRETFENPVRFAEVLGGIDNASLRYAISSVSEKMEQKGCLIESVQKNSEYLFKATYSVPISENAKLILAFDVKGAKDRHAVSNIRMEKAAGLDEDVLKALIQNTMEERGDNDVSEESPKTFEEIKDFRRKEYKAWSEIFGKDGFTLRIIKTHRFQDVFSAKSTEVEFTFRVFYNSQGFFSRIELISARSIEQEIIENLINKLA